jgi:hypothetical protein
VSRSAHDAFVFMVHVRHTKLGKKNASRQRPPDRGVTKSRAPNALAAAILSARKQKVESGCASTSSALDFLQQRVEGTITESSSGDAEASTLMELCRECVEDSGGSVALSVLGGLIREKAARRGLQASLDGPARPLHKLVKAWGGWGGFIRKYALSEFTVVDDMLHRRATSAAMPVDGTFVERPVEGMNSRRITPPAALTTKADVNAIDLAFTI